MIQTTSNETTSIGAERHREDSPTAVVESATDGSPVEVSQSWACSGRGQSGESLSVRAERDPFHVLGMARGAPTGCPLATSQSLAVRPAR